MKARSVGRGTRVVGYCRVSTEEQAQEGVSLDAQREKLEQYAKLYNYELVDVLVDAGLSGKSLERPALQKALKFLRDKVVDGLLVVKLDRLTRRVSDLARLLDDYFKTGDVHLLSVNEQLDTHSAAGRLLVHILASVAEWERETIAERIRDAMNHLKKKGVKLGAEAFGWMRVEDVDDEGRRIIRNVQEEIDTVDRIVELRAEGKSYREIAVVLEKENRPTKRGGVWQAQTIANICARAMSGAAGARKSLRSDQ
jgi:site-specific DNA recombinase